MKSQFAKRFKLLIFQYYNAIFRVPFSHSAQSCFPRGAGARMSRPRSLRNSAPFEPQKAMQKILDTLYLHREKEYSPLLSETSMLIPCVVDCCHGCFKNCQTRRSTATTTKSSQNQSLSTTYRYYLLVCSSDGQARLKKGGYTDFDEFVKDVAQIFHNAKFYNNKYSEVFQDAVTLEVRLPSI